MEICSINIQLSITFIARNFSRGRTLSMGRDRVDRAGGRRAAASLSAKFFDRCAGASSDGLECQFMTTGAFYCWPAASINKREWPLACYTRPTILLLNFLRLV